MGRKRTKAEAIDRLLDTEIGGIPLKGKPKMVRDAALLGAAGLIMFDPFNRLADDRIVLPLDMVCIPAYQAYMIEGTPSMQIYVRAGETIIPTGGNVRDVQEVLESDVALLAGDATAFDAPAVGGRKPSAYQKRYKKHFKALESKYRLKSGKWKKDGFKRCVKAAHAAARKGSK